MALKLKENEEFEAVFLLKGLTEAKTRSGNPYLVLNLGTSEVDLEGRMWDAADGSYPEGLKAGDVVRVRGKGVLYQDRLQVRVESLAREEGAVDARLLFPSSALSERELGRDLKGRVRTVRDRGLRAIMDAALGDAAFMQAFLTVPAAVTMHHARIGGLAEHSLGVCRLVEAVSSACPWLDRDLLVCGALLHDAGKVQEYAIGNAFQVTLQGRLVGHISAGVSLVEGWAARVPGFPADLLLELSHIVVSHHGTLEHGSPKTPATPEALVVHYADDLDAKLDMVRAAALPRGPDGSPGEAFVRGLRRSFLYFRDAAVPPAEGRSAAPGAAGDREDQPDMFREPGYGPPREE